MIKTEPLSPKDFGSNDTWLSDYFSLDELFRSRTAHQKGIKNFPDESDTQPIEVFNSLVRLTTYTLDPLRDYLGLPVVITSGYRCTTLNAFVGGTLTSQHTYGNAVDFIVPNRSINWVAEQIYACQLKHEELHTNLFHFDVAINEYNEWIHISNVGNDDKRYFEKTHTEMKRIR